MASENRYIIIREDLVQDPVTIITEGLLIGRLRQCELLLNHPSVSRVQAGFKQIDGNYYVFNLRAANPALLNGRPVEGNQALAPGDVIDIGPFHLAIDLADDALRVEVSLRIGMIAAVADASSPELATAKLLEAPAEGKKAAKPRAAPITGNKALDIFWDKRIREAGKMVRPSPLFPRSQRRTGKSQFNWTPTMDLISRWPIAFFIWAAVGITILSLIAAVSYTKAYAPAPLSSAHSKNSLEAQPPIAKRPVAEGCTGCHSFSGAMEQRCATCHDAEAFVATVPEYHSKAAIGCISCHAEHRGLEFKPADAALVTCTDCHNDANKRLYHGRKVGTPHNGMFGYPVVSGRWVWTGLSDEEWKRKRIAITRLSTDTDEQWRSKQFHGVHLYRVKSVAGIEGNADGQLSCSSCHKGFNPLDRETPRTTCGACHNGLRDAETPRVLIASDRPNCISCHVQHQPRG